MKVLVAQRGARHRYAVARMFEEAGMLAALYTDSTSYSLVGRLAVALSRTEFAIPKIRSLASRLPARIPREKVFSSDALLFRKEGIEATYIQWGLNGANIVYSMYGEEFGFLQWARTKGAKIIVDMIIQPSTSRIVAEESACIIGGYKQDEQAIEHMDNHTNRVCDLADIILCPSNWVAAGVREVAPECADKIRIVPYGSSLQISSSINESPEPGRIFFAGREPMRKGLHYLAEAASLVRAEGMAIDVRVAGLTVDELDWMTHKDELNCLGSLPLGTMQTEFRQADVFVLPSLSEGQAGVILEAMACGCPVIATRESGVDFKEGCGITVPSRNAEALAEALISVLGNRERRNQLARGALRQAADFSMEEWKRRLVQVVQEVQEVPIKKELK